MSEAGNQVGGTGEPFSKKDQGDGREDDGPDDHELDRERGESDRGK